MGIFLDLFRKLTDAYTKNPNSNIGKLLVIMSEGIDDVNETLDRIESWRDINQAEGTTLDLIGENVGQPRGQATDEVMRILIRARVARNLSDGTFDGVIKALAVTLNTTPDKIKIKELYADIDSPEPAAIAITGLPLDVLNNSGLSATQFGLITQRVLPGGVRVAVIELAGTFSFSSDQDHLVKGRSVSNFKSKVSGSGDLNPHVLKAIGNGTGLPAPSAYTFEVTTTDYSRVASIDSQTYRSGANTDAKQTSHLFMFKVIDHVERLYGPIPGATLADRVAWLKANISNFTVTWRGFGTYSGGGRANMTRWNAETNAWLSIAVTNAFHTSTSPQSLTFQPAVANSIDANGFIYVAVYSEPATASVAAYLETDYVELVMTVGTEMEGFADIAGTTGGTLSGLLVNDATELPI